MPRLMVLIPPDLLAEIDAHREAQEYPPPRTEAIRRLIRAGLDAEAKRVTRRRAA
jgi:metal-responsive CopG/Arc/MetJ family transcriptional regulator